MDIQFGEAREDNATGGKMVMVVDGYNAPIRWAAGCWIEGGEGVKEVQCSLVVDGVPRRVDPGRLLWQLLWKLTFGRPHENSPPQPVAARTGCLKQGVRFLHCFLLPTVPEILWTLCAAASTLAWRSSAPTALWCRPASPRAT